METVLADLCDGTAADWDVRVVAANDGPRTTIERRGNVDVARAATYGQAMSVPLCPTLPWQLWKHRADCVVLHEPNPIAATALWLHTPAPRLVVWHHSDLVRPWWAPLTYGRIVQQALYERADCVIVSSPALAAESALVRRARRVATIPFGVALANYRRADAARTAAVDAIRARTRGPRLLFVGRLVYYKGVHVLLEAARQWPGTLVIIGDGPLEAEMRARATALGIADRIQFTGSLSDDEVQAHYQACDALVLPSIARTEAFGVVQIEAMAAGLPVVSTRLPTGVPWVNQDGVSGIVVPPDDAAALGAALDRLARDAALRSSLADGARRRADAIFSRERMVRSFKDVVETVVHAPDRLDECLADVARAL
jgi:glycosyltransferase involved in cell wall biosynthesis